MKTQAMLRWMAVLAGGLRLTLAADQDTSSTPVRQIAIIGAGAAGASTAYHLHKFAEEAGVGINITIFEKTNHIGGRTLTVDAYDDPLERIELGASIFIAQNYILNNATQEFGLLLREPYGEEDELLAIWDGESFVYQQASNSYWWWDIAKMFWKYGLAPYRAQKLTQTTVNTFLKLYEAPFFPFRSLTGRAFELDLARITGETGEQYLKSNNIGELFSHDIIQAATRVNYASNLGLIHGLDTMVSMAPEGAVTVADGNWQIFDLMVKKTGASISLNTTVSSIALADHAPGSAQSKYIIKTRDADIAAGAEDTTNAIAFDDVVLAAPYQFSGIKITADTDDIIDEIPYVQLHVTLFASPLKLSAEFFNLAANAKVPTTVLTTLGPGDNATSGASGAGKAGFFSISTLRTIKNPKTGKAEYLYKVFSPTKLTSEWLSSLLGVEVPETFIKTFTETAPSTEPESQGPPETDELISWYYPHVFYSYPRAYPRVTFQDPILRDGLYYTSGVESFISTMETSALMGKNVARLIVDGILSLETGGAVKGERPLTPTEADEQRVLKEEKDQGLPVRPAEL
ncbi:Prenylcysteine oxidase [Pleurostoma richardsiae]|uniref:Prenylcysteine oxidase n=1 Tax=Pleurostoma richardsiae TaxID=41990 RepID=A0AA38RF43_9PEZI|nr:Prenylcysteine oxidase [Pleurostoma richardsiae]